MKPIASLLLVFLLPWSAVAASNDASAGISFQDFKIITQRNIFDPNRRGGSGQPYVRRVDPSRLARADGFSLVGTLIYDREALAFFDGTDSRYRKVLKVDGDIANYKITEVTATFVKLVANGNEVKLPVGMQMKKDGSEWRLMDGIAAPLVTADSTARTPAVESENTGDASTDEIMKRLMQKRAKELNK
jgi:hypothetical protein